MSWFSELKGKAEAMLIKLDQEAGEALQKENLLKGKELVDQALLSIGVRGNDEDSDIPSEPDEEFITKIMESESSKYSDNKSIVQTIPESSDRQMNYMSTEISDDTDTTQTEVRREIDNDLSSIKSTSNLPREETDTPNQPKISAATDGPSEMTSPKIQFYQRSNNKFSNLNNNHKVINKDLVGSTSIGQHSAQEKHNDRGTTDQKVGYEKSFKSSEITNKSNDGRLQSNASPISKSHINYTKNNPDIDHRNRNQPKLTHSNSHFDSNYDSIVSSSATSSANGLHQSSSFCIVVPDQQSLLDHSSDYGKRESPKDIAMRLLAQTARKKKSTFNIHQVINRLASSNTSYTNSKPIISDQMRIKFRRVQLRLASQARRLNYHFSTNRLVRYSILGYFLLMQLVIVYVLFFYQTVDKGGDNKLTDDLTLQVKKQQESLESQMKQWVNEEAGRHL